MPFETFLLSPQLLQLNNGGGGGRKKTNNLIQEGRCSLELSLELFTLVIESQFWASTFDTIFFDIWHHDGIFSNDERKS